MDKMAQGQRDYAQRDILEEVSLMLAEARDDYSRKWDQAIEEIRNENPSTAGNYEPTKIDRISHYLNLLYEAQRSGHEVHKEIDDALKQFKIEAGI